MLIQDVCKDLRIDPDVLTAYLKGNHKDFYPKKVKFKRITEDQYEQILASYVGVFSSSMTAYCHIVHKTNNFKPSIEEVANFWQTEGKQYFVIHRRNKLFVFHKGE